VRVYVCMHVCARVCMYARVYILGGAGCLFAYVCMYMCMVRGRDERRACMCVCVYLCVG
jgi:hypothetical protein